MGNPLPPDPAAPDAATAPGPKRASHPYGPLLFRAAQPTRTARWLGLVGVVGIVAVAIVLWSAEPRPEGFGTHTQLGLPPCSWPIQWGVPCPTCGVTTGLALFARGQLAPAARTQPLALVVGLVALLVGANAAVSLLTGRPWRINPYRLSATRLALVGLGLVVVAWVIRLLATRGSFG
jgi:uncharacterized membrane protein HdeD (DUF308 family)